ncbi:hypothetical protein Pmani_000380 [Petrolisthes manimaculis]|uniref:Uncharacterized protein n=1 Tax=Petrolisthes manimaculis TaxID=1843537 RepID=A0AAE1UST6_9EUCA|nr:hypothetical protein Pmani_000380 [Petrolisthes manimaculis]
MDDLLWVLTDSQLTAAFHFMDSLSDLIKLATQQSQKTKAVRKLESLPEFQAQLVQQARGGGGSSGGRGSSTTGSSSSSSKQNHPSVSKMFSKCDVLETSYHFYSERIDLHFCDDPGHSFPTSKSSRSYLSHPTYASCSFVLGMHTPYTCLRWKRYTSSPHMTL